VAVKIRLMRMGKKKQPTYRVVVADARSPRDGRIIERIGFYAPRNEPSVVEIDAERALHWLDTGAQPSESVQKLLEGCGVWDQWKARKPGAETAARKRLTAHTTALANRPAPEPEPEPEPAAEAPAAAEDAAAEAPAAAEDAAAEAPAAAEDAAEAPAAEPPAAAEDAAEAPAAAEDAAEAPAAAEDAAEAPAAAEDAAETPEGDAADEETEV
jgi:small subunit ribosomal protein S16